MLIYHEFSTLWLFSQLCYQFFYAAEVCPLSQSYIPSPDFAIFLFFMKLFQTNNKDIKMTVALS